MKKTLAIGLLFGTFNSLAQAPNTPVNPSPVNMSVAQSVNPNLCATVSDPNGGTMQVRFHGRQRPANGSQKFTIIYLPDTQYYTEQPQGNNGGFIAMFNAQTDWIASNRAAMNIVYVGHLGDCTQNGDNPPGTNDEIEWQRAAPAIATIESPALTGLPQGIPFGISVGNHDQTPNGSPTGTTTYFNQYFGSNHFAGRAYYGGHYGSNNDNHYQLFSASGVDFMVISFEYDQTGGFSAVGGALDWAEGLVQANSNRKVIVMTHYALNENTTFSAQGQAIYNRLKVYPNFALLLGGHVHTSDGEANRTDIYNGNTVHTLLSDYQERIGGGNGLLRIYEFDPALSKMSVKTYSPYTNTFETDADSQFELPFNFLPPVGQVSNVSSGTAPCFAWSNRAFSTEYEWNMELYDGQNKTIGPVWRFTTTSPALPVNFLRFDGIRDNRRIKLTWATVAEYNSDRFEVERSTDGKTFTIIGEVPSRGNYATEQSYEFYDDHPAKGRCYYRLRQVDIDGRFKHSSTQLVLFDYDGTMIIYPNPVRSNGSLTIHLGETIKETLTIVISDATGRTIYREIKNGIHGRLTIQPELLPGVYTLQLITDRQRISSKISVGD
jgi:hypothetical protein